MASKEDLIEKRLVEAFNAKSDLIESENEELREAWRKFNDDSDRRMNHRGKRNDGNFLERLAANGGQRYNPHDGFTGGGSFQNGQYRDNTIHFATARGVREPDTDGGKWLLEDAYDRNTVSWSE